MTNITVTNISYNYDSFYVNEVEIEKVLRDVSYDFVALKDDFKLVGTITFKDELTREEVEQKIKEMMK